MKLSHHNDGKQKWQSHEIFSKDVDESFDMFIRGYGETKEEAYTEFIKKLDNYIDKLVVFRKNVSINETVDVDCIGKEI